MYFNNLAFIILGNLQSCSAELYKDHLDAAYIHVHHYNNNSLFIIRIVIFSL